MGRLVKVVGPGVVWRLPVVDKIVAVDLDHTLPGWRGVTPRELEQMVRFVVLSYPEIPSHLSVSQLCDDMNRQAQRQEELNSAVDLAKAGRTDEAMEISSRILPGASRDIAGVHLKYLVAREKEDRQLSDAIYLAMTGKMEKAVPAVCKALAVEEDLGKRWLEFFLKGRTG